MITEKEITKDKNVDPQHKSNLIDLLEKANLFRSFYAKPMTVTSGYRAYDDQIRIYKEKGITDIAKIPMGSVHLKGQAFDVYDPKNEIKDFIMANIDNPVVLNFWYESFDYTPNWVHFQTTPPKSGKRFFIP